MKMEYESLSDKVELLLNREEGYDVDWKRNVGSLEIEDIVAFANSKNGGSVLLGVDEVEDVDGRQKAVIVGCRCSDFNRNQIKNKALNCVPPIQIEIIKENTNEKPFYRVEIPSGINKPYCTKKGIYKIRDDGHNKAITPNEMLKIFIDLESDKFITRFKQAAEDIENNLFNVSRDIEDASSNIEDILPQLELLEEYSYMSDEILGTVNKMDNYIEDLHIFESHNEKRILALLNHFNIEDPILTELKENITDLIIMDAELGKIITEKDYMNKWRSRVPRLSNEQLNQCLEAAINEIDNRS
ncbi:MAG: ATP-binding protein [Methanobacterium sp. ERen5]|nr:MAG: ATP-binding protein [Methanobacterium sp. ERen5]